MRSRSGTRKQPVKGRRRKTAALKRRDSPEARRRSSSSASLAAKVTRLARKLKEARERQSATAEVLGARTLELLVKITGIASSAPNVPTLASACLEEICELCQWQFGQVWYPDARRKVLVCSEESVAGARDFCRTA